MFSLWQIFFFFFYLFQYEKGDKDQFSVVQSLGIYYTGQREIIFNIKTDGQFFEHEETGNTMIFEFYYSKHHKLKYPF